MRFRAHERQPGLGYDARMSCPRAVVPILVLVLAACGGEADDGTATGAATGTDSANTDGSTAATTGPTTTATTGPTTSMENVTGVDDDCDGRPGGEWNACKKDGNTENSLCHWVMGAGEGSVSCLVPASGGYNACGINLCADDCDCFAPPATGTAIVKCKEVFADGGKACVLYCLNGQICPDGMECVSGTCYWPN